jgi:hypothetical protein
VILFLAEILGREQLLQADDLRSLRGRFPDERNGFINIFGGIHRTPHLDKRDSRHGPLGYSDQDQDPGKLGR